jgi:hypothetical protein
VRARVFEFVCSEEPRGPLSTRAISKIIFRGMDVQGTYDINMLVAAREVTGQAAFKPSRPSPALPSASRVR